MEATRYYAGVNDQTLIRSSTRLTSSTCVNCLLARGSTKARITPEITVADRSDRFEDRTNNVFVRSSRRDIMKCTGDEMGERAPVRACVRVTLLAYVYIMLDPGK